ncbi:MAG: hypothetical protein RE471_05095 [Ferroplasma sp.]|jgi:hypothetical protein|uniref:hypothetical protein n=1 Tax=Ferroplasma sp. TaxID=2591003 RepID=UPI0028162CA7|nr:hypothetical protein [Ferroplasma sp.]WMT52258.1 MAG: hypothetical protein RE471_05095 [Ferroplasma sp.]
MPVDSRIFNSSKNIDTKNNILDFLENNRENAYTLKELKDHLGKDHEEWMVHMELTSLIWAGKVEYRDIYDSAGKLVRYFKINAENKK